MSTLGTMGKRKSKYKKKLFFGLVIYFVIINDDWKVKPLLTRRNITTFYGVPVQGNIISYKEGYINCMQNTCFHCLKSEQTEIQRVELICCSHIG